MCVAGMVQKSQLEPVSKIASVLLNTSADIAIQKNNNDYRTQVALYNAKQAQNEAHRQMQLGIDKSRAEKIAGMQETNQLMAKQGASNFDISSFNSNLEQQDIQYSADLQSDIIKKSYTSSANNYFKQANSYLNLAKSYQAQYNKNLVTSGVKALGESKKVATDWFDQLLSEEL